MSQERFTSDSFRYETNRSGLALAGFSVSGYAKGRRFFISVPFVFQLNFRRASALGEVTPQKPLQRRVFRLLGELRSPSPEENAGGRLRITLRFAAKGLPPFGNLHAQNADG
jgi:hypothetical protein